MKTALLIDSSGSHYFQFRGGQWRHVEGSTRKDTLWVLVNLPEESLEVIDMPRLFGRDRSNFIDRRLAGAFPENTYRAAHILSGGLLKPGKVMLTGLTTARDIAEVLDPLDTPVVGVWGIAALLTIMVKRLVPSDILLALPSEHELRILVVKDRVPVLTRYVHRDGDSNADQILLTRQYLENQRIFERGKPPPVLFLGDASSIKTRLANVGLSLLPLSKEYLPKGEAGWLHPLFNQLVSSPSGQLAPLPLRARHLARNVRRTAYGGLVASLVVVSLYGQADLRTFVELQEREQALHTKAQWVSAERERLSTLIKASGADPELVRRATQFEAQEITAAPGAEAFLSLAAAAIAELPEARVKNLSFHLSPVGEGLCQNKDGGKQNINQSGIVQPATGPDDATATFRRHAEIQLTVMLPSALSPRAKIEACKRITAALQGMAGIKLLQDPAANARSSTLKGGAGAGTDQAEDRWCMSVPWKTPVVEEKGAL